MADLISQKEAEESARREIIQAALGKFGNTTGREIYKAALLLEEYGIPVMQFVFQCAYNLNINPRIARQHAQQVEVICKENAAEINKLSVSDQKREELHRATTLICRTLTDRTRNHLGFGALFKVPPDPAWKR